MLAHWCPVMSTTKIMWNFNDNESSVPKIDWNFYEKVNYFIIKGGKVSKFKTAWHENYFPLNKIKSLVLILPCKFQRTNLWPMNYYFRIKSY